jgi:hypothetical protein
MVGQVNIAEVKGIKKHGWSLKLIGYALNKSRGPTNPKSNVVADAHPVCASAH